MSLSVAVQMDPIERINIAADSTFRIMEEAQARGHRLFYYTPDRLALDSDRPGWDTERRIAQVLASVRRDLELHGWDLSWDPRGIRLSHGVHALVLGLPASLVRYVHGSR